MRKIFMQGAAGLLAMSAAAPEALSAPKFSAGTSVGGVIAYQDSEDKSQFHYLPTYSEALLGERLKTFRATHYGIGRSYFVQGASGEITSRAGAIVSGSVSIDISAKQREAITVQITKDFGVASPKLLPLKIVDAVVSSVSLGKSLTFNDALEQQLCPSFQIASECGFSIGSQNSGFGHIVAASQKGGDVTPNPHFGMNVVANAEFQGDPWTAVISCDLKQVWEQVRTKASASVSVGWFRLGSADYSKIASDLAKSHACKFEMKEGSLDTEKYGREVMDMTKKMFEAVNKAAVDGEGFFKFEPNPEAPAPGGGGAGGGTSLFGISVSLNLGYSSSHFTQSFTWNDTVTYTGRFKAPIVLYSALAVSCGAGTKQFFQDLGDTSEPCVTQAKADLLKGRLAKEGAAKLRKYEELLAKVPPLSPEQFERMKAFYDRTSLTEFATGVSNLAVIALENGKLVQRIQPILMMGSPDREFEEIKAKILSTPQ